MLRLIYGTHKTLLMIIAWQKLCIWQKKMSLNTFPSCRTPGKVTDIVIFCHAMWLSDVNVAMEVEVFNQHQLWPEFSVSNRLSAAAPGELRGHQKAKLYSPGWLTANVYWTKNIFHVSSTGRNQQCLCLLIHGFDFPAKWGESTVHRHSHRLEADQSM